MATHKTTILTYKGLSNWICMWQCNQMTAFVSGDRGNSKAEIRIKKKINYPETNSHIFNYLKRFYKLTSLYNFSRSSLLYIAFGFLNFENTDK